MAKDRVVEHRGDITVELLGSGESGGHIAVNVVVGNLMTGERFLLWGDQIPDLISVLTQLQERSKA